MMLAGSKTTLTTEAAFWHNCHHCIHNYSQPWQQCCLPQHSRVV